ncbi:extracellular solute-binding protein [Aestuariirhabdus litorea]|uniref:Putrescine-binding periplasmic protein n=1 Tax=Aestuariirhabdus litorea TaxID=2528527 RepID=A0A3P3VMS5_9GAMM|nr:extracellular solute-binding protein [Aestuariirhabdus litorea]RRJ84061.1 extracellular solute-binding protein [Aestuariirhabdus litorea]RWW97281.1 extracellular solute-binding protein [Endozoicomonadaceae bacterium GTF-13]
MNALSTLMGALVLLLALPLQAATLRVLNWSDYVDEAMLEQFKQEQGIELVYELFESEDEFLDKLFNAREPWDVIVPPSAMIPFLSERQLIVPLDLQLLPMRAGLDQGIMKQLEMQDPGNRYAVPYMWGTTGLGVNEKMLSTLGIPANKMDSWSLLYDDELRHKASGCGIALLNESSELFASALVYLGHSVNTTNDAELQEAADLLKRAVGDTRYLHTSQYSSDLASGKLCVAVGYSGDILADVGEAENADVLYHVPVEGAAVWFDVMAIPAASKQKALAHRFINFMIQPETAAANTNYVAYPNAVPASLRLVDAEVREDPAVYPSAKVQSRLQGVRSADRKTRRIKRKLWVAVNCHSGRFCQIPMKNPYGY